MKTPSINENSIFFDFETDASLEQSGIKLDYGKIYFIVARAGGANKRFRDAFRAKTMPHKRAMATETLPESVANQLAIDTFAETVVLQWGSHEHGEGKIAWRDGSVREFSVEAVKELFTLLPTLATDVMTQAQNDALFRKSIAEADAKN